MTLPPTASWLRPGSVAVIGGSHRPGSVGYAVLRNILAGGFCGQVLAVNPHLVEVPGAIWSDGIAALPTSPDLAIVACPSPAVTRVVEDLGRCGVPAAVVLSNGFEDDTSRRALRTVARSAGVSLIGPNSVGLLLPHVRLNASFADVAAAPGRIAFISQSGALVTAMLDWAQARSIGFSAIVSIGDMVDIDFADLIDLYAADPGTDAILLYLEGVSDARRFLSAARAATLVKPVIVLKAGRSKGGVRAAFTHTGALAGAYDVHEAAFRRVGVVLVDNLVDLLDVAQVLVCSRPHRAGRLGIVSNGGGAGILAIDALAASGGQLATLAPTTFTALDAALPPGWSRNNPVDIIGDADAGRMEAAVAAVLLDDGVDAVLVLHCPTAMESAAAMADAVVRAARGATKPDVGVWLGPRDNAAARNAFTRAGLALVDTIESAVRALRHLHDAALAMDAEHRPAPTLSVPRNDPERARAVLSLARSEGRSVLSDNETRAILMAYEIPLVPAEFATTPEAIPVACKAFAPPYVLKLSSPELTHKSDVGGIVVDVPDAATAVLAAQTMATRVRREHPEAQIAGFVVEPMVREAHGIELLVGVADDPVFGPVILFGSGGTAVEVLDDHAIELPPLDDTLARAMIARTRVSRLLTGYRTVPPADVAGIVRVLEAVSAMVADLPELVELDINPLLVSASRVTALDVRIRIGDPRPGRLAIRPRPVEWTADLTTRSDVHLHVRPVRADDEALLADFFCRVTPEDRQFRFLTALRVIDRDRLVAMTQVDYARTMHFLAFVDNRLVASAMIARSPGSAEAEVALSVDRDFKDRGVSWTLLKHVLAYARAEGIATIESLETRANQAALSLECEMGFAPVSAGGPETLVRLAVGVKGESRQCP